MQGRLRVSDTRTRVLRSATSLIVMCGWSLVLTTPIARWFVCEIAGTHGFTNICGSTMPAIHFWTGMGVILIGTVMQFALGIGAKDFAGLVFAAFFGGCCLAMLSLVAQFLFLPWMVAVILVAISISILVYFRRGETGIR